MSLEAPRWRPLRALPTYFGGKRRLVATILREVDQVFPRRRWPGMTLVDAFLGGGSVSLWAKAQGFSVLCNDLADRSRFIAEGLLCNDGRTRLSLPEILPILADRRPGYAVGRWAPDVLTPAVAAAVDALVRAAERCPPAPAPQARPALLRLLAWKIVDYVRPFGQFRNRAFGEAIRDRDFDRLSSGTVAATAREAMSAPLTLARKGVADLDLGLFPGRVEFRQDDAFHLVGSSNADVLYLDPPYTGSSSYESEYEALDSLLAGRDLRRPTSVFNAPDGLAALDQLLAAARGRYRLVVLSFGATTHSADEVFGVARSVLPSARRIPLDYRWSVGNRADGSCQANDKEVLIVADGDVRRKP